MVRRRRRWPTIKSALRQGHTFFRGSVSVVETNVCGQAVCHCLPTPVLPLRQWSCRGHTYLVADSCELCCASLIALGLDRGLYRSPPRGGIAQNASFSGTLLGCAGNGRLAIRWWFTFWKKSLPPDVACLIFPQLALHVKIKPVHLFLIFTTLKVARRYRDPQLSRGWKLLI